MLPLACSLLLLAGCQAASSAASKEPALKDGAYSAEFITDSSMFRVNEANGGRGVLTVENGAMTLHVSLPSQSILYLYPGSAADAQKEGAALLSPTLDTVIYNDGTSEEVHGFDIPVPALDEDFALALIGAKGKWYDHTVSVTDPLPADGAYTVQTTLSGGSGRASIASPAALTIEKGKATATVVWSSPFYAWMQVDGVKYEPVQAKGNATFIIPVTLDADMPVFAQTLAMSAPHVVEYTLRLDSSALKKAE